MHGFIDVHYSSIVASDSYAYIFVIFFLLTVLAFVFQLTRQRMMNFFTVKKPVIDENKKHEILERVEAALAGFE